MDNRKIETTLTSQRQALLSRLFPEKPAIVARIESFLLPSAENSLAAPSPAVIMNPQANANEPQTSFSLSPFTAPQAQASLRPPHSELYNMEDDEEEKSVPAPAPLSLSLTAQTSVASTQPFEKLAQKLNAANLFRSIIKSLPEQFRVRKNDLRYDRNSPEYRKLFAQRFDFKDSLADLEIKFKANGLDTRLIVKAIDLCATIQESIECADKPGSLSENALTLWVNELIRETEAFCDSIDDQCLLGASFAKAKKENLIVELDSFTFEQHLDFCLHALAAIEHKDYAVLTSIAWEFATTFHPKTSGKIVQLTEEEFKNLIKSKREVDSKLLMIALKLFRDTLHFVKTQAWDDLLTYIMTIQPSQPVYEEKEREQKFYSGLQQHHMHAASSPGSTSATSQQGSQQQQASTFKHS